MPPFQSLPNLSWIQTQPLANVQLANQLQRERGLDAGEL